MESRLTVGSDPELFLKSSLSQKLVASIGIIGGTKDDPRPYSGRQGFYVQEDNVAVEFNIPPAYNKAEFVDSIHYGIAELQEIVSLSGLTLHISASEYFPPSELSKPGAGVFGCTPDYNAWEGGDRNPRPDTINVPTLRSCGGHVHIGFDRKDATDMFGLVKACDITLGAVSVLVDNDDRRRHLYGKAGCYRPTPYGVEYRVLSNFWLRSKELTSWVYDGVHSAMELYQKVGNKELDKVKDVVYDAINRGNKDAAGYLMQKFEVQGI